MFRPLSFINATSKKPTGAIIFFHGSVVSRICEGNNKVPFHETAQKAFLESHFLNMPAKLLDSKEEISLRLSGIGDTGEGVKEYVKFLVQDFEFPHLQVLFPTAPLQPYTPLGGQLSNVWFDRLDISPDVPEVAESLKLVEKNVLDFIQNEVVQTGIPENRIIVGGFSMGGALALHIGYRLLPQLAGVFALSSFLNYSSLVYKSPKQSNELPALFMCHGDRDMLVPHEWGEHTFKTLTTQLGIKGEFHTIKNALHELKKKEILQLQNWLNECLPHS